MIGLFAWTVNAGRKHQFDCNESSILAAKSKTLSDGIRTASTPTPLEVVQFLGQISTPVASRRDTGETILLAQQNGTSALYVDIIEATTRCVDVRAGMTRPLSHHRQVPDTAGLYIPAKKLISLDKIDGAPYRNQTILVRFTIAFLENSDQKFATLHVCASALEGRCQSSIAHETIWSQRDHSLNRAATAVSRVQPRPPSPLPASSCREQLLRLLP